MHVRRRLALGLLAVLAVLTSPATRADYTNFEVSHVHPVALTPSGSRLLVVNTPDALLEVFTVLPDGGLDAELAIPVGLEPVTVVARSDTEAWVVNNLSDSVSIVDTDLGVTTRTLTVGDEPTDVVFAGGKAFVSVSTEDVVRVYDLADLDAPPSSVPLFGKDVRALAVSNDGQKVYAVVLRSGNETTVVGVERTFPELPGVSFDPARLSALGLRDLVCEGTPPAYPPLPAGITRNPALIDPPDGIPKVGLIVKWNEAAGEWRDETGQDWTHCLPYRLADNDLFVIDAGTLAVSEIRHLGTSLFEVSVHPTNGKIYVPNTDARNFVRFEHPLGVRGHMVDNRMTVVDPGNGNAVTLIDLNTHIDRESTPPGNLAQRLASISQPGMMTWRSDGSFAYLTAIGSRKLFRMSGSCLTGGCIFGADRAAPDAVEVGEGPTGVALLEQPDPADDRLYVLNRISHSVAIVAASTLTKLGEVALHDPSSEETRNGRRFLYDGIDTSQHGDASCASCHVSGDMDGLAWDLGNPEGDFVPYSTPFDNIRFVFQFGGQPADCPIEFPGCAGHDGFDPQKGPMTTQTLRAMIEPLHWRGDRSTMNAFNMAFPDLMGTEDIGPIGGKPAGIPAAEMELFRQFMLAVPFPPNPFRRVDGTMPCGPRATDPTCEVQVTDLLFPGNPTEGQILFDTHPVAGTPLQACQSCHTHPFGTGGGILGGVEPTEPTSFDAAPLFNGDFDGSLHSDMKIPHLRNMYEKAGPVLADPGDASLPFTKTGFGYLNDGSIPDLHRFLSEINFNISAANGAQQVRDMAAYVFHFDTGTRPAIGRQVTFDAGTPPTGSLDDETLLATLVALGDLANGSRHCELVATARAGGRLRAYHLSNGVWVTDVAGETALTTTELREAAQSRITFLCTPLGSGVRLGGNRDEDVVLNGDDCAPGDPDTWIEATTVAGLSVRDSGTTELTWTDQSGATGPSVRYDVLTGDVSDLVVLGLDDTSCLVSGLAMDNYVDPRPNPDPDDGYYYLVRARNPCGVASLGTGREALEELACP